MVVITAPLDGGLYTSATLPPPSDTVTEANNYAVSETGCADSEGMHIYTVTAVDEAGNTGSDAINVNKPGK